MISVVALRGVPACVQPLVMDVMMVLAAPGDHIAIAKSPALAGL